MNRAINAFRQFVLNMNDEELHLLKDCWEASFFNPAADTLDREDKWLILAIRILSYMDRDDVADGLDSYYRVLEQQLNNKV